MALTNDQIKTKLIEAGVKNLREFGYPAANAGNILTDVVYSGFFKSMLNDNIEKSTNQVDGVINELLQTISNHK